MTLAEWLDNGWLKFQETSLDEINNLIIKIDRDIAESAKKEISFDWRLAIAYNACLGCATVALRACGYRVPGGAGQHYRKIQSLKFTFNPDPDTIITLESICKKRGIVSYDAAGTVTETEVNEARVLADELRDNLIQWLKSKHPQLYREYPPGN